MCILNFKILGKSTHTDIWIYLYTAYIQYFAVLRGENTFKSWTEHFYGMANNLSKITTWNIVVPQVWIWSFAIRYDKDAEMFYVDTNRCYSYTTSDSTSNKIQRIPV